MNKCIISIFVILLLSSCSFKKDEKESGGGNHSETKPLEVLQVDNADNDGDLISNSDEIRRGLNPNIANIPSLQMEFAKDFTIKINYKTKTDDFVKTFEIDTKKEKTESALIMRAGEPFYYDLSKKMASERIKTSKYNMINLPESGFRRFSSPDIPRSFINRKLLEFYGEFNKETDEIVSIEVETINLVHSTSSYIKKGITDLELSFLLFDEEMGDYVEISSGKVDKTIGYDEVVSFNVTATDIPADLFFKNFFEDGKFFVSEIKDYNYLDRGISFSNYLEGIKKKTMPVAVFSPTKKEIKYVAVNNGVSRIDEIIKKSVGQNYIVSNNELVAIDNVFNNLDDFESLSSLEGLYNKGSWLVISNELTNHYLDHRYTNHDSLIFSYFTGDELASNTKDKKTVYKEVFSSKTHKINLGSFSKNSSLGLTLSPRFVFGEDYELEEFTDDANTHTHDCHYKVYKPYNFKDPYSFSDDLSKFSKKIVLSNGAVEFSVHDLAKKGIVTIERNNDQLTLYTKNISGIFNKKNDLVENLYLIARPFYQSGIKGISFKAIPNNSSLMYLSYACLNKVKNLSGDYNLPYYLTNDQYYRYLDMLAKSNYTRETGVYRKDFSFSFISTINQFY